ncbi:hypothetical protein Moror_9421 [Moniliophthora roreri MCA 2997]|uniref:LysM domain-containing protein n=2 Tax=Moniliophthora roreri TaxID=221103 RepID=V2X0P0_MONRO|nr:hypothetical protein Moror_9421 [Moniliophthora roreri MCA 2997]KAI3610137.1 hypothetical protein WG66_007321 [Moniliophthora roreri]
MSSALLCLACSSNFPPRRKSQTHYTTPCCKQPICNACTSANPRLTRYNPCLMCLGGVDAVGSSPRVEEKRNVDGAVRDEDTFAIGDDDEDEEVDEDAKTTDKPQPQTQPSTRDESKKEEEVSEVPRQAQYHIKRGDTLQGIVLKFSVNREQLCRLNNLPLSTLTTTPHLLHTRTVLLLPDSARITDSNKENISFLDPDNPDPERTQEDEERLVRRAREKAGKRLQTLTKEVDWDIAKAYVALAEGQEAEDAYAMKQKELGTGGGRSMLEAIAMDAYLDDAEWEVEEVRAGRGPMIKPLPFFGNRKG